MAYVLPQVLVHQLFSEVPTNTVENLNCFVFGPNYRVWRYTDKASHDLIGIGEFKAGVPIDEKYPMSDGSSEPDPGSAVLYAEDAVVQIGYMGQSEIDEAIVKKSYRSKGGIPAGGERYGTDLKFGFSLAGDKMASEIRRDVSAGDTIVIGCSGENFESTVVSVYESEKGSGWFDCARLSGSMSEAFLAKGTPYGESNDGDDGDLSFLPDTIEFKATIGSVEIPREDNGGIEQWSSDDVGISSNGTLKIMYSVGSDDGDAYEAAIESASLFLQYRELRTTYCDAIHSIESASYVSDYLGEPTPDNPLALGVYKCCLNAGDRVVRFMATRGESLEDYNDVLQTAEKSDDVYMLVPLTSDDSVLAAVQSHVDDMSSAENKLWRIAFVAPDTPETKLFYTASSSTSGHVKCLVSSGYNPNTRKTDACVVRFFDGLDDYVDSTMTHAMSELVKGDVVRIYDRDNGKSYSSYKIDKVISDTSVRLSDGVVSAAKDGGYYDVEVCHNYSYAEKTSAIASRARHFMDHRMYYVFPEVAEADGVEISGPILAAACAGLASSVLPQQPITNVELVGIDDVPISYRTYSRTQLNEMAEAGVFIVMQDLPGDRVYVRHQLSTETSSGNLLKQELSIVKNLDSISYYLAEAYKPYIGRYNITEELIAVLRNIGNQALQDLESTTSVGLYGPQVIPDGSEIRRLYQHPVRKDHVYMEMDLNLPKPFNNLDLSLQVI